MERTVAHRFVSLARSLPETWSLRDLARVPSLISLSRFACAAAFPIALGDRRSALAVVAWAGLSDVLDGWYARRFHQESATGAILDGLADKAFVLSAVVSLVAVGDLTFVQLLLLGTRDLGELAIACKKRFRPRHLTGASANAAGKVATLVQFSALLATIVRFAHRDALVWAAAAAGVIASVSYWRRDAAREVEARTAVGRTAASADRRSPCGDPTSSRA